MAEKNMNAKISVEFEETVNRQQLSSGDNLPTLFGKIRKFLTDLKAVAFSGSYNDLSNTPTTATTDTDGLMSASDKSKLDDADNRYALKSKYGDTTINVGRKAGTDVGEYSTAEGYGTAAIGRASHTEGSDTTASGNYSHAEGCNTTASGIGSHAEGSNTTASGNASHTSGYYTKALHDNEAAYGKYNESNDNTLFSIGDGTADDARHNAFEITTTGGKLHDKDIATSDDIHTHSNKDVLDATTASFTTTLKTKLDGIETGANKTIVDTALSSTSTNPVQNKIVNSALSNKVDKTSAVFSTYNSVTNFGVTNASSPNDIWAAIPNNSIVIVVASTFTHSDWNFPSGYQGSSTVVFVKVNTNRLGGIYLVPKTGGQIFWSNVGSDSSYNANWRALMNGRIDKGQASLKAGATKCITNHNFEFLYCLYWTSSAKFDGNHAALISVTGDTTSFTINSAYSDDRTIGYIIYGN